jgi:hypothetical protein
MPKRKKIGDYILRGQIETATYNGSENRIHLFDGKYTSGYVVKEFLIVPQFPSLGDEFVSILSTQPKPVTAKFQFTDSEEMAWAIWNAPLPSRFSQWSAPPRDDLIVEDLWINMYTTSGSEDPVYCNYYIHLEKYSCEAWDGALALVKNNSQAGPQDPAP